MVVFFVVLSLISGLIIITVLDLVFGVTKIITRFTSTGDSRGRYEPVRLEDTFYKHK